MDTKFIVMSKSSAHKDMSLFNANNMEDMTGKELYNLVIENVYYGKDICGISFNKIQLTSETYMQKFIWIENRLKEHNIVLEIVD